MGSPGSPAGVPRRLLLILLMMVKYFFDEMAHGTRRRHQSRRDEVAHRGVSGEPPQRKNFFLSPRPRSFLSTPKERNRQSTSSSLHPPDSTRSRNYWPQKRSRDTQIRRASPTENSRFWRDFGRGRRPRRTRSRDRWRSRTDSSWTPSRRRRSGRYTSQEFYPPFYPSRITVRG